MKQYYAEKLSGERLRRCYEIAPTRIKQYLKAELDYVFGQVRISKHPSLCNECSGTRFSRQVL